MSSAAMIHREHDGLPLLHFPLFESHAELACAVSTRRGPGGLEFNLGPVRGPDRGARAANWRRFALAVGLNGPISAQLQVHGPDIAVVDGSPPPYRHSPPADASFTGTTDVALLAFSADCPLVAVYQPEVGVGVAHASWRCTTALIVRRLVEQMIAELGCDPSRMMAAVSPSAGPCCYEVGQEVYDAAAKLPDRDACFARVDGRLHFDLWQAASQQLQAAGIPPGQIELGERCTICTDEFFSYRREGIGVGSFGLIIGRRG